nr:AMP-binding protein [Micromonospora sp. DSM 115978]
MAGSGETLTYAELDDRSLRLANLLRAAGLGYGAHVALLSENSPRCYEVYWAALRAGLYVTPVNSHLSHAELAYIVNNCGATALVVSAALAPLSEALVSDTPAGTLRLAFGGRVAGHLDYA